MPPPKNIQEEAEEEAGRRRIRRGRRSGTLIPFLVCQTHPSSRAPLKDTLGHLKAPLSADLVDLAKQVMSTPARKRRYLRQTRSLASLHLGPGFQSATRDSRLAARVAVESQVFLGRRAPFAPWAAVGPNPLSNKTDSGSRFGSVPLPEIGADIHSFPYICQDLSGTPRLIYCLTGASCIMSIHKPKCEGLLPIEQTP